MHSDITNKVLSRVTEEFANPNSHTDAEIMNGLLVTGDLWIRQPKQPLGIQ
jgi:hypothetical protein